MKRETKKRKKESGGRTTLTWYVLLQCAHMFSHPRYTATSTAVERVFSKGRHLLPYTWNRLSASSIRASLCLGDWCRKNLIAMSDVIEAVQHRTGKGKCKRVESDAEAATVPTDVETDS